MDHSDRQPITLRTFLPVKRSIAAAIAMVTCIALMDDVILVVAGALFTIWVWGLAIWAWRRVNQLDAAMDSEIAAEAADHEAEMRHLREQLAEVSDEVRRRVGVIRDVKVAPVDDLAARRRRQAPLN